MKKIIYSILFAVGLALPSLIFSAIDFSLDKTSVVSETAMGEVVGAFSEPDATYTFESGTGGEDNDKFTIDGNELKLNFSPDYENPTDQGDTAGNNTYTVKVKAKKTTTNSSFDISKIKFPMDASRQNSKYGNDGESDTDGLYGTTRVNENAYAVLKEDGTIVAWGLSSNGGTGFPTDSGYTKIYSSRQAFAALKSDGSITAWGNPDYGGTGAPTDSGYTKIYSTIGAFAALKSDGTIVAWGHSNYGGTGAPTGSGYVKITTSKDSFFAFDSNGAVTAWGGVSDSLTSAVVSMGGSLTVNLPGQGFKLVENNSYGVYGLKNNGKIIDFNGNYEFSESSYQKLFVDGVEGGIGSDVIALTSDGSVEAKGLSSLTLNPPTTSGWKDVVSNQYGHVAVNQAGELSVWGSGFLNNNLPTGLGWNKIYSASGAFAALKNDGTLSFWGNNSLSSPISDKYTKIYSNTSYDNMTDSSFSFAALKSDGSVDFFSSDVIVQPTITDNTGYITLLSNSKTFVGIKSDGTLTCWGVFSNPVYCHGAPTSLGDSLQTEQEVVKEFVIEVVPIPDTGNPVITINSLTEYDIPLNSTFTVPEAKCMDNTDGDISSKIVVTNNVNTALLGTYEITYNCKDNAGNEAETKKIEINVIQINDLDIGIEIPLKTVVSKMPRGYIVSNIKTDNVPENITPVYSLVSGDGDDDNEFFKIEEDKLKLDFVPDFENPDDDNGNNSYKIRVESAVGASVVQKSFTIYVLPENIIPDDKYKCKGYAWSQGIGWVSLNCANTASCNISEYGVNVEGNGELSGYAWTPNVSWLNVAPTSGGYTKAKFNGNNLEGQSVFQAGLRRSDDGWNGLVTYRGTSSNGSSYGVTKDASGKLNGYAWGQNTVGWLGFPENGKAECPNMLVSFTTADEDGMTPDTKIEYGKNLVLKWKTEGVESCKALNGGSTSWTDEVNKPISVAGGWQTETIENLEENTNFTLECEDSAGNKVLRNLFVFVKPPEPEINFWATKTNIPYNTKAKLNWNVKHATNCVGGGSWSGVKNSEAGDHSEEVGPLKDHPEYTFKLTCKSNNPEEYGNQEWYEEVVVNIAKLEVSITAKSKKVPFNRPVEILVESEFSTQCKRSYEVLSGQSPLYTKNSTSETFNSGSFYPTSTDYAMPWESEIVEEPSSYKFIFECNGLFGQYLKREVEVGTGKVPTYIEN